MISLAMPKKFPINYRNRTKYSSCKDLKLSTKGFDFKKDISNPVKCQKWAERFKLELRKGNKCNILSDFQIPGFLTNINEKLSKKSIEKLSGRPLKCLNMNNPWNKKFVNNNSHNAVTVEFDNMYLDCRDSKLSIGREIELQHLKELNILHLDIVQQQAEELIAKDKIIKALQEENKILQARLERIDRRVSLSLQKKGSELSPISVETDFANNASFLCCDKTYFSPKHLGQKPFDKTPICKNNEEKSCKLNTSESSICNDIIFSKKELLPKKYQSKVVNTLLIAPLDCQALRVSPRERRLRKDINNSIEEEPTPLLINEIVKEESLVSFDSTRKIRLPVTKRLLNEELAISKKVKSAETSIELEKKSLLSHHSLISDGLTDHSLRSREKHEDSHDDSIQCISNVPTSTKEPIISPVYSVSLPVTQEPDYLPLTATFEQVTSSKKLNTKELETHGVRSEGILSTTEPYYLPTHFAVEFMEVLAEDGAETQLEIPKWRVKPFSSLYAMEGTENLEDEIFLKRHAKLEQDERRRKRWDLQRMREQREYEKLRERYEKRNSTQDSNFENAQTLWPSPESTHTILIENTLPVCAFGQPLEQIPGSDFSIPWLTGKTPLQVGNYKKRRKKLI